MENQSEKRRTDAASRIIKASPHIIYEAHVSAQAVASWRPPTGMQCRVYKFEPWVGGVFRMSFIYKDTAHPVPGKTSEHEDVFHGQFLELTPDSRIVEQVAFESTDPALAGAMTITTMLTPVASGTEVTIICGNVPPGIKAEDHQKGITSTLNNLARFTEIKG